MSIPKRSTKLFFAVPCGEFYAPQAKMIGRVCTRYGVEAVIAEEDFRTAGLWDKICEMIDESNYFMADISSGSQNIVVELGYTLSRKPLSAVGIFASKATKIPSDLTGFVRQEYGSLMGFERTLNKWVAGLLGEPEQFFRNPTDVRTVFEDDFLDRDRFDARWSGPIGSSLLLTHEGLRFGHTHVPLFSTSLGILRDCEFEFTARIVSKAVGWAVKGTKLPGEVLPSFCVMFNINSKGVLLPHVWNRQILRADTHYHVYREHSVDARLQPSEGGWFTVLTRVRGDTIEVLLDGTPVFHQDFSEEPFAQAYLSAEQKDGQVGFRCHPTEEAVIRRVVVRELS